MIYKLMKKKEFNELKSKTAKDLKKIVFTKKLEAEKSRMNTLAGKEKNLKVGKNLRREIAKILTLIREKEIVESLQPKVEDKGEKTQAIKKVSENKK